MDPDGMSGPMWMPHRAPDLARLVEVHLQPLPILPLLGLVFLLTYGVGVVRLAHRGVHWPIGRTVAWVAGVTVTVAGLDADCSRCCTARRWLS